MFKDLIKYKRIFVAGPQRSGTTIAGKMIASDLGYEYVDESTFRVHDTDKLDDLVKYNENIVIQCPGLCHVIEKYSSPENLIIFMMRDVKDIISSQERKGWRCNDIELAKYGLTEGNSCEIKYAKWPEQKKNIINWKEIEYESMKDHPLWIGAAFRGNFRLKQTHED